MTHRVESPPEAAVVDPVCGMTIDPADAAGHVHYEGTTYYFCNPSCLERFTAEPRSYLPHPGARVEPQAPQPGTTWTCPMHPEIVRDRPGSCPICGMALEPMTVSAVEPE